MHSENKYFKYNCELQAEELALKLAFFPLRSSLSIFTLQLNSPSSTKKRTKSQKKSKLCLPLKNQNEIYLVSIKGYVLYGTCVGKKQNGVKDEKGTANVFNSHLLFLIEIQSSRKEKAAGKM